MSTPTPQTPDTPDTTDIPDTPESTHVTDASADTSEHTLADEVFVDDDHTQALPAYPTSAASGATATATAPAPTQVHTPAPAPVPEPTWIKGPAPFALVLGLLGLLVAGAVLVNEIADVSLPWDDLGPWSVVAAGVVVLLVGAIGLRSSRAGRD